MEMLTLIVSLSQDAGCDSDETDIGEDDESVLRRLRPQSVYEKAQEVYNLYNINQGSELGWVSVRMGSKYNICSNNRKKPASRPNIILITIYNIFITIIFKQFIVYPR